MYNIIVYWDIKFCSGSYNQQETQITNNFSNQCKIFPLQEGKFSKAEMAVNLKDF